MNEFLLKSRITLDAEGNVTNTYEYSYDENGNLIEEGELFSDLYSSSSSITYTYDENSNLATETAQYNSRLSNYRINYYTYDENGNLATTISESGLGSAEFASDATPYDVTTYTYTYDENNNLVTTSTNTDDDVDGNVNSTITTYTYDGNNNLIELSTDDEVDGDIDSTTTYTYDGNNNLIEETSDYEVDDGDIDSTITYTYDDNNNLVTEVNERNSEVANPNGNGIQDLVTSTSITTYTYDENGNLIEEIDDYGADNITDLITTYIYDENNNLVTENKDSNNDGVFDEILNYTYIRNGRESGLSLTDVHRFLQYEQGFHFYTSNSDEVAYVREQSDLGTLSYEYEAPQYRVLADNKDTITGEEIAGVNPVYRFFNTDTGAHLYTMSEDEKDSIQANLDNYSFEGIQYYAFESEPEDFETIGVYRLLNTSTGAHLFSSDRNEIDNIEANLPNYAMENNGDPAFYVFEL